MYFQSYPDLGLHKGGDEPVDVEVVEHSEEAVFVLPIQSLGVQQHLVEEGGEGGGL